MRELLPDNLVLAECMETLPARVAPAKTSEQREVGSLLTWVSSFATYIAVVGQAHPDRVADMLAYMRLIIRRPANMEAMGGLHMTWCHERKSDPWNYIDPSLHTAYIGGQGLPPLTSCRYCNKVDHCSEDCAIAPTLTPTKTPTFREPDRSQSFRSAKRPPTSSQGASGLPQKRISISWNKGRCLFPGACSYQHICASCQASHPAKDCPLTPADSAFKQLAK